MIRIVFKFRKWWWCERIRGGVRLQQDLRKVKKHPFNLCIQRLDSFARPRFLCVTRSPPSEHRPLLSERLDQPISTTITYPWNTGVSSKNIFSNPYYCYSRSLAITSWVKCTCSPTVHRCTPTALPERINAFSHRC